MVFVTRPSESVHDDSGEDIWWSNQALRLGNIETHTDIENDGQEVGNGVCHGGCEAEESSECPDLEVECILEVFADAEVLGDSIMSIFLDSCNDKGSFLLIQELDSQTLLGSEFWEVADETPADEANCNGEGTLKDEDPSPASKTRTKVGGGMWVFLRRPWNVLLETRQQQLATRLP